MERKCANCENRDDNGYCEKITEVLRFDAKSLVHGLPTIQMPDNGYCLKFEPSAVVIGEELDAKREFAHLNSEAGRSYPASLRP